MNSDNLRAVYQELCNGYHKVDDFRAKLLGFLPLASGVAIFSLLDPGKDGLVTQYLTEIGLLGALITSGLLIYELKGIQKCTGFIHYGAAIESKLPSDSAFTGTFSGLYKRERGWWFATEPVASAIIYSTVLAAWVYVASFSSTVVGEKIVYLGNILLAILVGVLVLLGVYAFWWFCASPKVKRATSEYKTLPDKFDYLAPDGSEIRLLLTFEQGGLCHCSLPGGMTSNAVKHKTVSEIWYFLEGAGEVARKAKGEEWEITRVSPGACLTIPVGVHFQFRNTETGPLRFMIATMPAWPGSNEAVKVDDYWQRELNSSNKSIA